MVVGCSTKRVEYRTLTIDEALLVECLPMPVIPVELDGTILLGELVIADAELAALYAECSARVKGLINAYRRNTK